MVKIALVIRGKTNSCFFFLNRFNTKTMAQLSFDAVYILKKFHTKLKQIQQYCIEYRSDANSK